MPRRKVQKEPEINSDDELSASGPEISDDEMMSEDGLPEHEVMRVQGIGRSDSEDDDDYEEYEANDVDAPKITSKDAFGRNEFIGTDMTEKKRRKLKRDEKREIAQLEELDADERRQELNKLIGTVDDDSSSDEETVDETAAVDDSEKTPEEKLKLLKRQSPELFPLLAELKVYKAEMSDLLIPLTKIFTDEDDPKFVKFIQNRLQVVRAYCVNIAFYLRLRAKAVPSLNDHPVIGRLAQLKTLIDRLTSEKTNDFAMAYLEMYESERAKESASNLISRKETEEVQPESENEDDQAMADFEEMTQGASRVRNVNSDGEEVESDEDDDGKRKITYQMDKNKGFIPKRQKKRRNPRVKHRVAYAEAIKRRKGAVREVKKETTKYAGEASGIKVGLKKSVRTKY